MHRSTRRTLLRWLLPSAGILVLMATALWLAAPAVIAVVVERQLRSAGWTDPSVTGVSLAVPDVLIDRVQFAPGDAFVVEDIRARIGRRGIESVAVSRLRLALEATAGGGLVLPDFDSRGNGVLPLDLLPPRGARLAEAEIRLTAAAGETRLSLADATVTGGAQGAVLSAGYGINRAGIDLEGAATAEIASDGAIRARLAIADGRLEAAGVRAVGVAGEAVASRPATGAPAIALDVGASETFLADAALGALALEAEWQDGAAEFALTSPDSRVAEVAIEGRADVEDGTPSASASGRILLKEAQARGQIAFEIDIARAAGGGPGVNGHLQLTARGLALPGMFAEGFLDLAADVAGDAERLRLTATNEWIAELTPAAARVPTAMRALAGEDVIIAVAPRADEPLTVQWALQEKSAWLEGELDVRAGSSRLEASATLAASWAKELVVTAEGVELNAQNLPWGSAVIGVNGFDGTATYSADQWTLNGAGTFDTAGAVAGATVEGLTARWSGTATGTPESVVVTAVECVTWSVAAIELAEIRLASLSPPCISPNDEDVLVTFDSDEGLARFDVAMAEAPLEAGLVTSGEETGLSGTWPALRVIGAANPEGLETLSARASGGALTLPRENVSLNGVDAAAEMRGHAIVSFSLSVAAIEHLGTPALWVPLGLEATATGESGGVSFEAVISDDLGVFVLEAAGRHEDGRGGSEVTLYPIRFISGAVEMADLSPRLAELVQEASGTVGFEGEFAWGPDGVQSSGSLNVEHFGAGVSEIALSGVDTRTSFGALLPPATLPEQTMEIERIDLGLPLEHGVVVYDVDAGGRLAIHRLAFDFAGGRLFAEPFTVDSAETDDIRFALRAEEVELSQMLALSRIEGLEGTGVLTGRVPVRISDQGLQLDEGVLAAETDGILRYTPEDLPSFLRGDDVRSTMLREALTNFRYDELSITIADQPGEDGAQTLTFSAQGANPDFLEGHPVELNFNFRGPLLGAVRSAVDLSGAVEVREALEQQDAENEESIR